jgi:ABC-type lipopolysaccharide export system ATPase subunit
MWPIFAFLAVAFNKNKILIWTLVKHIFCVTITDTIITELISILNRKYLILKIENNKVFL